MNYQQLYQEKKTSLEDCLAMIDSNTAICMGGDCIQLGIGSLLNAIARQLSGSGGAFAFAYGAFRSKGGRGILAFPSMTAKGASKINALLSHGAVVTVPRNYVDYIVTEYGVAALRGRTVRERAQALIGIAHPDVRDELQYEAKKLLYI